MLMQDDSDSSTDDEIRNDAGPPKRYACVRQLNLDMILLMQVSLLIRQPGYEEMYLHRTDGSGIFSTQISDEDVVMGQPSFSELPEDKSKEDEALRMDDMVPISPQDQIESSNKQNDQLEAAHEFGQEDSWGESQVKVGSHAPVSPHCGIWLILALRITSFAD